MDIFPVDYLVDRVRAALTKEGHEYGAFEKLVERGRRNMARQAKQNDISHGNEFCLNVGMLGSSNVQVLQPERYLYVPVDLFMRSNFVGSFADKVKSATQEQDDDSAASHRQTLRDARTLFMRTLANTFGDHPVAYPVLPTSVAHIDPNKPRTPNAHNVLDYLNAHGKKVDMNVFFGPIVGMHNEAFLCGDKMMREYGHMRSVISEGLTSPGLRDVKLYWDNPQKAELHFAAQKSGAVYGVVDMDVMKRFVRELQTINPSIGSARGDLSQFKLGLSNGNSGKTETDLLPS